MASRGRQSVLTLSHYAVFSADVGAAGVSCAAVLLLAPLLIVAARGKPALSGPSRLGDGPQGQTGAQLCRHPEAGFARGCGAADLCLPELCGGPRRVGLVR